MKYILATETDASIVKNASNQSVKFGYSKKFHFPTVQREMQFQVFLHENTENLKTFRVIRTEHSTANTKYWKVLIRIFENISTFQARQSSLS